MKNNQKQNFLKRPTFSTKKKIEKIIKEMANYLNMHGGDVKIKEVTEDGLLKLEFLGACVGCSAAQSTLDCFLKETVLTSCPEIIDVEVVNMRAPDHTPVGIKF